jgi:hypothetical protein
MGPSEQYRTPDPGLKRQASQDLLRRWQAGETPRFNQPYVFGEATLITSPSALC